MDLVKLRREIIICILLYQLINPGLKLYSNVEFFPEPLDLKTSESISIFYNILIFVLQYSGIIIIMYCIETPKEYKNTSLVIIILAQIYKLISDSNHYNPKISLLYMIVKIIFKILCYIEDDGLIFGTKTERMTSISKNFYYIYSISTVYMIKINGQYNSIISILDYHLQILMFIISSLNILNLLIRIHKKDLEIILIKSVIGVNVLQFMNRKYYNIFKNIKESPEKNIILILFKINVFLQNIYMWMISHIIIIYITLLFLKGIESIIIFNLLAHISIILYNNRYIRNMKWLINITKQLK